MEILLIMCVFLQKCCCHELKWNRNFCEIFFIFTKFLFYFIIIHQLHALSHKTKKIYAKSTLRNSNVFANTVFQKNHFSHLACTEPSQLAILGDLFRDLGGGQKPRYVRCSKKSCHVSNYARAGGRQAP